MTRSLTRIAVVTLALGLIVTATACGRGSAPEATPGVTVFAPEERVSMPTIGGTDLEGTPLDLSTMRGQVIVLNSWASWCAPCRDEIPRLREAATAHPDVRFVGLNVEDDPTQAKSFAAETGITWPSIVDADGTVLPTIPGVPPSALPSTVVIDDEGRIAVRIIGPVKGSELTDALTSLADGTSAG